MLSVRLDNNSPYAVRWPTKDDDIIALGDAWIAYETTRGTAQLKDLTLALVQAKLTAAKTARATAQVGEATRTISSGDYRTARNTIKTHLDRVLSYLKYKHAANLLLLENWGWNVRTTAKGGLTVRMPTNDAELFQLLNTYIAYETSLAPAERITDPPLATMQALATTIQTHALARLSNQTKRTANVYERSAASQELLDLLQGAAIVICLLNYNGQIHPNLANWGYTLNETTPPKEGEEGAGEPPE